MIARDVPFFKADIDEAEIDEVVATLRSGWLTTGPRVRRFEQEFARAVGAKFAIALNSCTAALHLAAEALQLKPGQGVLVPTMTFAATAEVVRYLGGIPVLVDCDPQTGNMDLDAARQRLEAIERRRAPACIPPRTRVTGLSVVHVGGLMMNLAEVRALADQHGLWIVEDAAHAFPAAWRASAGEEWQRCGEGTAAVTCFSYYANKTITTGEGGMAVTDDPALADRMRLMSLHGLSHDAWQRYSGGGWDYKIVAPGYKYNLTDIAAAIGLKQLDRAEQMRRRREQVALRFLSAFADVDEIELPPDDANRVHAWHLFPIKLQLKRLTITRNDFVSELKAAGIGCSVHWRPLHLHPYYQDTFGYRPEDCPAATALFERILSLPIFPTMTDDDIDCVVNAVKRIVTRHSRMALKAVEV
jgi:dTDP-4-amino-4,6-dideoxygalactose transaminase